MPQHQSCVLSLARCMTEALLLVVNVCDATCQVRVGHAIAILSRLSVRPSVRLSATLVVATAKQLNGLFYTVVVEVVVVVSSLLSAINTDTIIRVHRSTTYGRRRENAI